MTAQLLQDRGGHVYLEFRQGRKYRYVVPMSAAGLRVERLTPEAAARRGMQEVEHYPVERAAARFLRFGRRVGMSAAAKEALRGLSGYVEGQEAAARFGGPGCARRAPNKPGRGAHGSAPGRR